MRITVESIDAKAMDRLGFTQIPSFPVRFSSAVVSGTARFVPASSEAQHCAGQSFDVEINQEKVTNLERISSESGESVVARTEPGVYQVSGRVSSVVPLGEPEGSEVVTVAAGEAMFTLSSEELGSMKLLLGERVSFVVHTLSLWDEAI
jgi:hypothetical protein